MHNHTQKELDIILEVMKFFSLDIPHDIEAVSEGLSNRNYFVTTCKNAYFVKFVVNQNIKLIENDIAIQKQIKNSGLITPLYLPNLNGKYIFQKEDSTVVISKKIQGSIPRIVNKKLAFSIGAVLSQFHTIVKRLPHDVKGWMDVHTTDIISEDVRRLKDAALPNGITHGDMHNGNVLVLPCHKDEVYAILDFEEVGKDLFLVDLARSILGVCGTKDGNELAFELVKAELDGYESVRRLTEIEKDMIPYAINYSAEVCIKWFIENSYEKYVDYHRCRAKSFISPFDM